MSMSIPRTAATHILDSGPKAARAADANMPAMSPSFSSHDDQPHRRFLLLPEQTGQEGGRPRPIRRYRLASIAGGDRAEGADASASRHPGERLRQRNG